MEILGALVSLALSVLGVIWSIVWWFLSFLLMPLIILLVIAGVVLRYAYRTPRFKPYVERLFARLGEKGMVWLKGVLYAVSVYPIRVLIRFLWFSIWHAFINLWWRPRWSPWERALENKPAQQQPS